MIQHARDVPNHHTIGIFFKGWNGQIYYCDSHDSNCGYWMTGVIDPWDRRNISERAIGRTFHEVTLKTGRSYYN